MIDESTTNSQITDSVTQSNTTVIGQAPASTQGLLDAVMAETIGMSMHNAVSAQQNSQMMGSAAVAATCARLIKAPTVLKPPAKSAGKQEPGPPPDSSGSPAAEVAKKQVANQQLLNETSAALQRSQKFIANAKEDFKNLGLDAEDQAKDQILVALITGSGVTGDLITAVDKSTSPIKKAVNDPLQANQTALAGAKTDIEKILGKEGAGAQILDALVQELKNNQALLDGIQKAIGAEKPDLPTLTGLGAQLTTSAENVTTYSKAIVALSSA